METMLADSRDTHRTSRQPVNTRRTQPVIFVTIADHDRVIPLAFFHLKKSDKLLNDELLTSIGARIESSSGTKSLSAPWTIILGRHMSRPEANGNGLNEFMRAVLSLDQISFVMTHQAEQDRQTIMNKYRFKVPELTELTPWKERATDLNWEYCECGCKCFHVMVGQLQFSLHSSTVSSHYLRIGHGGHGRYLGIFPNMEAASARVLVEVRGEIDRMKQTLRMLGEL